MSKSRVIIIAGAPEMGKTTLAKKIAKGKKHWIFDFNNDWNGYRRWTDVDRMQDFLKGIYDEYRLFKTTGKYTGKYLDSIVVIEEATVAADNHTRNKLFKDLLVVHRHSGKIGTSYVLLYHSLGQVPDYVRKLADMVILFKTQDNAKKECKDWANETMIYNGIIKMMYGKPGQHVVLKVK